MQLWLRSLLAKGIVSAVMLLSLLAICAGALVAVSPLQASQAKKGSNPARIETNRLYYLVPASLPARAATFEVRSSLDYALLSTRGNTVQKSGGTPVKFLRQPDGLYKIQMQAANNGGKYTYFVSGAIGIYLGRESGATRWAAQKAPGGGFYFGRPAPLMVANDTCYLDYNATGKAWLGCHNNSKPIAWKLVPAS